ncbi:MAG: PSD1 and planctomycete cytochrome C domain-containing protein [Pirellula sp.]
MDLVFCLLLVCFACNSRSLAYQQTDAPTSTDKIDFFERKVRPILIERCYECHSSSAKRIEGNLRLDHISLIEQGGDSGASIDRENVDQSLFLQAIRYDGYEMPPSGKLPQNEIDVLTDWVRQGAYWPEEVIPVGEKQLKEFDLQARKDSHWVWQSISSPTIPTQVNLPSGANPIDAFIGDKLSQLGLQPAPIASRNVLISRLHWDLLGLPPSIDTIERWTADPNPDWYSQYLDELLADPQFGVRFARHWLDLVRYAQSRGHEFDEDTPGAEHYRDYVLRAWNSDLPYDQFLAEHVAGDLLEEPRRHPTLNWNESILGTGFWHLGEWVHSPVDVRKDEADRFDNMVDVFSKSFLGLTVSCARCHDHKFDAISTEDYYALFGVLRSSHYRMVRFDSDQQEASIAQQQQMLRDTNQSLFREQLALAWKQARLQDTDSTISVTVPDRLPENDPRTKFDSRSMSMNDFRTNGQTFGRARTEIGDIGLLLNGQSPTGYSFRVSSSPSVAADPFWSHQKSKVQTTNASNRNNQVHIAHKTFLTPTFTLETDYLSFLVRGSFRAFAAVDSHRLVNGPLHGETIFESKSNNPKEFRWVTSHNLGRYKGKRFHLEFSPLDDQNFELFQVIGGTPPAETAPRAFNVTVSELQQFATDPDYAIKTSVNPFALGLAAETWLEKNVLSVDNVIGTDLRKIASKWHEQLIELRKQVPIESMVAMAMHDGSGQNDFLLIRGNADRPGNEVPRRFLEALGGKQDPLDDQTGSGRLKLVEQMLHEDNPLVARVVVNRLWQHLLGRGIVATPDDFGVQGRAPTHPELLDYLSVELRNHQWSPKSLIKLICESHVYKQSVAPGPFPTADANNDYLSFSNVKKLEGESVRDGLLYVAGQLDMRIDGGTSRVYLTDFMTGRGRPGANGSMNGDGRRSLFLEVRRNFLNPMLTAFDMPTPFSSMGKRNASNVPGQALTMINDPLLHWVARKWAERELGESRSDEERLHRMLMAVTGRRPTSDQLQMSMEYLTEERKLSGSSDPKEREIEIWSNLAHAVLNSKTMLFRF